MKIYISGKITGLNYEEAESLFMHAETVVEKAGHTVLNPMKLVDQHAAEHEIYEETLMHALRIVLIDAEAIYMLPNWRDSRGARTEHAIAEIAGIPIFYAASDLPLGCDWPEQND